MWYNKYIPKTFLFHKFLAGTSISTCFFCVQNEVKRMENRQYFNVEVPIPDDLVIIHKEEYVELLNQSEKGVWWTIDKVVELLDISRTKLINDILLNPDVKEEIDIELNPKGFVVYPKSKGVPYRFLATQTREYFEKNFGAILLSL